MHRALLLCLLFVATPAEAAPTKVEAFFAAIEAADRAQVEAMLGRDPQLASARLADGRSAVAAAGTMRRGNDFVCTHDNPVLRAILARAPALDVFDASLVGDVRRLSVLIGKDPGLLAARHPFGWTPLHFAAFGGSLDAVKLLLDKGAALDPRSHNRFHNTPLQTALLCSEGVVVAHLLGRGADPNVRQGEGFAPLHDAAFAGRIDLLQLLLDHGSDLNPRSDDGETPLATAERKGKTKAAGFLRARGAKK